MIFWNSAEISLVFCQCKRSLQSRRYYSGFWSRGMWPSAESPDRGPRRNAHYTCTVKGRENHFFAHALFVPKPPNFMGFSGSVNGTTKNPGFLDFGFCQCKCGVVLQLLAVAFDRAKPCAILAQRGWGCCCWGWGDAWENCLYTKGILCAKVCTRLNHLGAKIEKSPYQPPSHTLPPHRSVATLPHKVAIFLGIFYLKCWEVWIGIMQTCPITVAELQAEFTQCTIRHGSTSYPFSAWERIQLQTTVWRSDH